MSAKILILGSTGFVGKNLAECLENDFKLIKTCRRKDAPNSNDYIFLDLFNKDSWGRVVEEKPDIVINAAAYGVVKLQQDLETTYNINFFLIQAFYNFLTQNDCHPFWIQIGTAFEYDLSAVTIDENTVCLPQTHYGISKLMMSNFLKAKSRKNNFTILRPFGMFGKYEDDSKFFPMLISSQKNKNKINLSPGTQKRDYVYVKDLGTFIKHLILEKKYFKLPQVINIGSGKAISFKDYASILQCEFSDFDPELWNWGAVSFRQCESEIFYSSSLLAISLGFKTSSLQESFKETSNYYYNN